VNYFIQTNFKPIWMLIKFLPVLPPNLRPVVTLENTTTIITDLNFLYSKIISVSTLIKKLRRSALTRDMIAYDQLLLQKSVDKLINNEKSNVNQSSVVFGDVRYFIHF
jgi:DNA-directed RNA polymerase beta' subunit